MHVCNSFRCRCAAAPSSGETRVHQSLISRMGFKCSAHVAARSNSSPMNIVPSCSSATDACSISAWAHSHSTGSRCARAGNRVSASSTVITSPSAAKQAALTPHSAIASGTIASASCRCSSVSGTSASQRISRHAYTGTSTVLFGASPPLCIIASIVCDSCCSCSCVMRGFTCFLGWKFNCKKASQRVNPSARTERSYFRILYCTPFFVIWEGVSKKIVVPCQFCTNFCAVMP